MDDVPSAHPSDRALSAFGLGKLDDRSAGAVNKHLERCPYCRQRVADLSADSFLGRMRDAQPKCEHAFSQSLTSATDGQAVRQASAPPAANTLPPGLADHPDYKIKRELGRGGMGVVYLAENKLMGRDEVLKVMGRHIMDRPGVLDRFLREIRAVARLRHPNIVTAYHATRLGESIVFAMEYVPGYDLAQLVNGRGPLPVPLACNFVYQAALGLQHAHEEGLVHRDIKPSNLMLARKRDKPTIKVLDFGLAKATREERVDSGLTGQGQMLGTPDCVAPEQIRDAQSADIRADIYSLGCTLYHLLAGRPPFAGDSLWDLYQAHFSMDAGPLNLVRSDVPAELASLAAKMMQKEPASRFQTPAEVAKALTPFFKAGNVAFKSRQAQMPVTSTPASLQPVAKAVSNADSPATYSGGPGSKASPPTAPEVRWDSLIALSEAESPVDAKPAAARTPRPPWLSLRVALAVAAFCLIALGVIIIRIRTSKGEIKVTTQDDTAIKIETDRAVVEVQPTKEIAPEDSADAPAAPNANTQETPPPAEPKTPDGPKPGTAISDSSGVKLKAESDADENAHPAAKKDDLSGNVGSVERADKGLTKGLVENPTGATADKRRFLFNGKDLDGWKNQFPDNGSHWSVVDNALVARGSGIPGQPSILVSERQNFANFRLRFSFRVENGGGGCIEIRRSSVGAVRSGYSISLGTWPNIHALNLPVGSIARLDHRQYGTTIPDWTPARRMDVAANDWHEMVIAAEGNRITVWLDRREVNRDQDNLRSYPSGEIVLGGRADSVVRFKEIMIEELPDGRAPKKSARGKTTRAKH